MKKFHSILFTFLFCFILSAVGAVNDTFFQQGVQYQISKENFTSQTFEVSAIHYDTTVIVLPDFVTHDAINYAVTGAIAWYHPRNCALRHYNKIDLSQAKHLAVLSSQISALIAIDTLILPPNLLRFPENFYTSDTISWRNQLLDEENLLPGIHRVYSTGTQNDQFLKLHYCTSLIEADLSTYTTTYNPNDVTIGAFFCCNPFLTRLVLPNTIKVFYDEMFERDIRLTDLNIPDSLVKISGIITSELPIDTLRLGEKVSEIYHPFASGWYELKHIEVDPANPYFMDDNGILYTKNQHWLYHYPYTRDGKEFHLPRQTDTIGLFSFNYGWAQSELLDGEHYVHLIKNLADSAPLKTVVCHPALKYVGPSAFAGSSVRTMSKFGETQVKSIPVSCFMYSAIDSITLPYGLTEIDGNAFAYTYNLRQVMNLSRLRYLQTIGEGAFKRAWLLNELDLLACNKVLELPQYMCQGDSMLQVVSFPRNVQSIGDSAFAGCVGLQQIVCPAVTPIPITPSVFDGVDKQNCVLKVLPRSLNLYQNAPVWEEFFKMDTTGFYYIETSVSDTSAGSVTEGGAYLTGEYVTITAEPNPGYRFVSWEDGYQYSTRFFQVTKDESFTAIFEEIPPTFYTLTVLPNDSTMGEVSGSGQYEAGTQVTLTAAPYEGFIFRYWSFTDLTDQTILYTMPAFNATVLAFFVPRDQVIDSPYLSAPSSTYYKILRNNQILILSGANIYSTIGQKVK